MKRFYLTAAITAAALALPAVPALAQIREITIGITTTTNARRFVTESKADIIMGSAITPPTIAVSNVANEAGIPHFGLSPFPITPERAKWSVAMPQPIPIMGKVLYEHMKSKGVKTVGYIGYSDSYG